MTRPLRAPGLLAVLLLAPGCAFADGRTPTEAEGAPRAAKAGAAPSPPAPVQESSLCAAYGRGLAEQRAALARGPADEALRESVATFEVLVADACS